MPLKNGFSERLRLYLYEMGYSRRRIKKLTLDTRLYHDMRIFGDSAREDMQVLVDKFEVDMSGFDFHLYFPKEYPDGSIFVATFLPEFLRFRYVEPDSDFKPLTFRMIQRALETKKWQDE